MRRTMASNWLDMSDGQSAWKGKTAFLDADGVNLSNADADSERIYSATCLPPSVRKMEIRVEVSPNTRGSGGWVVRAGLHARDRDRDGHSPRAARRCSTRRAAVLEADLLRRGDSRPAGQAMVTRTVPAAAVRPDARLNTPNSSATGAADRMVRAQPAVAGAWVIVSGWRSKRTAGVDRLVSAGADHPTLRRSPRKRGHMAIRRNCWDGYPMRHRPRNNSRRQ
ncbi:MAG: hypothetical protein U0792_09780 [Gemmataceae bacterium]